MLNAFDVLLLQVFPYVMRGMNEDSNKAYEFERVEDSLDEDYELERVEDSLESWYYFLIL
jgi:hypothetical protein